MYKANRGRELTAEDAENAGIRKNARDIIGKNPKNAARESLLMSLYLHVSVSLVFFILCTVRNETLMS
jgi:hypothetical protein